MSNFLYRLGRLCVRRRWRVLGLWIVATIVVVMAGRIGGGELVDKLTIPGSESQRTTDLLMATFPQQAGGSLQIVIHDASGAITEPGPSAAVTESLDAVDRIEHVEVLPRAAITEVSDDGTTELITIRFDADARQLPTSTYSAVKAAMAPAIDAGLQVEYGGDLAQHVERPSPGGSELIGLVAAMVILLIAFGSVIAMGLPIGTALFGLGFGIASITVVAAFIDMPTTSEMLATMIGLGVGIDYALFIITRHRAGLHRGLTIEDAAGRAIATAGLAVMIAGGTVVIAICGLAVAGIPLITLMGIGAAIVVAVMVIASITLLPALMGFAGHTIDRFGLPFLRPVSEGATHDDDGELHGWARWADHVSRHPVAYLVASLVVVLALAAPVLDLRLGQTDASQSPTSSTLRRSYDLLADGFGPGFNGPLVLAVDLRDATVPADAVLADATAAIAADPDVDQVARAVVGPDGNAAVITVIPVDSPQAASTTELVDRLRADVLPSVETATGAEILVGGQTAVFIDLGERAAERLPWFIGAVVGLSFVLLMIVFRSILVPLKAALMNLLAIGAAYGVMVAVFQWGWGGSLFGVHESLPIVAFIPMFMFAILFGLSMDYEVFILSRVREE